MPMHRCFPQPWISGNMWNIETKKPVKTQDGGYIFSYFAWQQQLHSFSASDVYTIKTDSNFVPQWRKPYYSKAIQLPTGGIVLIYSLGKRYYSSNPDDSNTIYSETRIEKISPSGAQIWIKRILDVEVLIKDGIRYSDKIRLVGRKKTSFYLNEVNQAYSMEMDTMGNIISEKIYNSSTGINTEFSRIKRDTTGNFYMFSAMEPGTSSKMLLTKFDVNFNFVWAKTTSAPGFNYFTDIDFLPGGTIFASGLINSSGAALFKFSAQGNLISQLNFIGKRNISELTKKANGNFVAGTCNWDSLFLFETDTSLNVLWNKYQSRGWIIGGSVLKSNKIFMPIFVDKLPYVISSNMEGDNCKSVVTSCVLNTIALPFSNLNLIPVTFSTTVIIPIVNVIYPQTYVDSCFCQPSSPLDLTSPNNKTVCINSPSNFLASGLGNLYWYSSQNQGTPLSVGDHFSGSFNPAGTHTLFIQDSTCTQSPNRVPISFTVLPGPPILLAASASVCPGSSVSIVASGANSYTWTNPTGYNNNITVSPTINTT